MPKDPVRYKTLSPGCVVDLQALSPDHAETRLIGSSSRRKRPSAGIIVESETDFPIGSLVVLDLKFPGQVYTYRSRGMVSWSVESEDSRSPHKLGILMFFMDKLDERGVSLSVAAASPIDLDFSEEDEGIFEEPLESDGERDEVKSTLPPPPNASPLYGDRSPVRTDRMFAFDKTMLTNTNGPQGSTRPLGEDLPPENRDDGLVPVCATDIRITKWLSRPVERTGDEPAPTERIFHVPVEDNEIGLEEIETPLLLGDEDTISVDLSHEARAGIENLSDLEASASHPGVSQQARSSVPADFLSFVSDPKQSEMEENVEGGEFDAEHGMIQAFERMHMLYRERDVAGAGRFALTLARELIATGGGSLFLVSPKKFNLYVVADDSPGEPSRLNLERPVKGGILGLAIQTGSPVICNSPSEDPNFDAYLDINFGLKVHNVLAAPVQYMGHAMGAMLLRNSHRGGGFVQGEADLLAYIGSALADYIHTSLLGREDGKQK